MREMTNRFRRVFTSDKSTDRHKEFLDKILINKWDIFFFYNLDTKYKKL